MLTDTTFGAITSTSGANAGAGAPMPSLLPIGSGITRSFITWEEIAEGLERSADVDRILQQVRLTLIPKQVAWETSRIQRELAVIFMEPYR